MFLNEKKEDFEWWYNNFRA